MTETASTDAQQAPWEGIDRAVWLRLFDVLGSGANLLSESDIAGRLDPLSTLPAIAKISYANLRRPNRAVTALARAVGDSIVSSQAALVRALGGTSAYAPDRGRDKRFKGPHLDRQCRLLVAASLTRSGPAKTGFLPGEEMQTT